MVLMGFSGRLDGKESICNVGDLGSIPGLGRIAGEGNSYPLQYSVLENSMDIYLESISTQFLNEVFKIGNL